MRSHTNEHNNPEYMIKKNTELLKYIEKYNFTEDGLFKNVISANGSDEKEVLALLENGLTLISEDQNKAKIYFLAVSLLDNINLDLGSIATDIMLYAEEKNDENIPKEFSSIDDIQDTLIKYKISM